MASTFQLWTSTEDTSSILDQSQSCTQIEQMMITFEDTNLSAETEAFLKMIPFQIEEKPYLQIKNAENRNINLTIFEVLGR